MKLLYLSYIYEQLDEGYHVLLILWSLHGETTTFWNYTPVVTQLGRRTSIIL